MSDWISPAGVANHGSPGFQSDGSFLILGTPRPSLLAVGISFVPILGLLGVAWLGSKPTLALILRKEDEVGV